MGHGIEVQHDGEYCMVVDDTMNRQIRRTKDGEMLAEGERESG